MFALGLSTIVNRVFFSILWGRLIGDHHPQKNLAKSIWLEVEDNSIYFFFKLCYKLMTYKIYVLNMASSKNFSPKCNKLGFFFQKHHLDNSQPPSLLLNGKILSQKKTWLWGQF